MKAAIKAQNPADGKSRPEIRREKMFLGVD